MSLDNYNGQYGISDSSELNFVDETAYYITLKTLYIW